MTDAKTIIISAADDLYAPVANDLFLSIARHDYRQPLALGLLDVGFNPTNRQHFNALGVQVVAAGSDIDYPARSQWEAQRPSIRTLTARPFLPRYFPGYDIYIWLDADVWVQTPAAIDAMIAAVADIPAIAIVPELDRCYPTFFQNAEIWQKFSSWYEASYAPSIVADMLLKPMLNAGVFALRRDSPVWAAWGDIYRDALQRVTAFNDRSFMADQLGLNILCYLKGLPHVLLPASFNWLTAYAIPKLDRATGLYVETQPPHQPLSQIHLTRPNKLQVERIECLDGGVIERPLTFYASRR